MKDLKQLLGIFSGAVAVLVLSLSFAVCMPAKAPASVPASAPVSEQAG